MLAQPISTPIRLSRIYDGLRPSVISATPAIDQTGTISIINGSGIPIYIAQEGSAIPFIIPTGQAKTIQSIAAKKETFYIWNSNGQGPSGHCLHRESIAVVADAEQRIYWTGLRVQTG